MSATDVPDWTTESIISSGTVAVSGGSVAVSSVGGTVAISGPVTVSSGTVAVSSISGTVAISGPVTVTSGTVAVSGISGTVTITGAVTISSGTIAISSISGTVNISGPVSISAGQNSVSVSIDTPPILLTAATGANPLTIASSGAGAGLVASGTFNLPANATGICVLVYDVAVNFAALISGGVSSFQYAYEGESAGGPLLAAIPGQADNPVTVKLTAASALSHGLAVASVYAMIGTGIQQIYDASNEPVVTSPGTIIKAAGSIEGVTGLGLSSAVNYSYAISAAGLRYLRHAILQATANATLVGSGVLLYVKGHTSGTILVLLQGTLDNSNSGFVLPLDLSNFPLDLVSYFPTDTQVDIIVVAPANTGWSANTVVTP